MNTVSFLIQTNIYDGCGFVCGVSMVCSLLRYELDQMDTPDKYPDLFSVSVDLAVSPNDRPQAEKQYPWFKFSTEKLTPRILFSGKDELHQALSEFGKIFSRHYSDNLYFINSNLGVYINASYSCEIVKYLFGEMLDWGKIAVLASFNQIIADNKQSSFTVSSVCILCRSLNCLT